MLTPATPPAETPRRPNIVLIITDDQGYGDLGCHGNDRIRTPNLDRMAAEGARFSRFYVCPVCSPTRAGVMTGRWNYRTGVVDTFLGRSMMRPTEVTLPEMLHAAGYRTGLFGKWHLGDNAPMRPMDKGFDEALWNKGGGLTQPADPEGNSYTDPVLYRGARAEKQKGYVTDVITDAALSFMERNRTRPFFLYHATVAPHTPLEVPDAWVEPYRKDGLDEETARVYAMVENIDTNVGRLLHGIREMGMDRQTLVVFVGDNGPAHPRFNCGLRGLKGSPYEGGVRVPCLVRWPGSVPPSVIDTAGANVDLAPTLLEMAGAAPPKGVRLDGRSLAPLLRGERPPWPERTLFYQWHRGDEPRRGESYCAIGSRYKLVNGTELYDMASDPAETRNLAAEMPGRAADLRRQYDAWFDDVSSQGFDPPRILIGSSREPVSTLTRQDFRGPTASWAEGAVGYWEVEAAERTRVDVRVAIWPITTSGRVTLRLGGVERTAPTRPGARTCTLRGVDLPAGPARLEAWCEADGKTQGARYVVVQRRP